MISFQHPIMIEPVEALPGGNFLYQIVFYGGTTYVVARNREQAAEIYSLDRLTTQKGEEP